MGSQYKNAKVYKILNHIDDDVYVGSTCQPLSKRMAQHRQDAVRSLYSKRIVYEKMTRMGFDHFYIELVEECPCDNKEQLRKKEGQYIRDIATLNNNVAGRSKSEYKHDNKDRISVQNKEYAKAHREHKTTLQKERREENIELYKQSNKSDYEKHREQRLSYMKTKHDCECGGHYMTVHKIRHMKSNKHQTYLKTLE